VKVIRNTGNDRVLDILRPSLVTGQRLDLVTSEYSLFAFETLAKELCCLVGARLLLPPGDADLELLGGYVGSSRTTCVIKSGRRSSAGRRTSKRWQCGRKSLSIGWRDRWTRCWRRR